MLYVCPILLAAAEATSKRSGGRKMFFRKEMTFMGRQPNMEGTENL
ncbi:MAG: hypothetical protein ABSD38_11310 [Syntrophorhabdales bacterium]